MTYRPPPPLLDMTLDGRVRPAPRVPVMARVIGVAIVVAVLCTLLSLAALAIWVAAMLIPIAIGAAAVAWVAFRVRRWQGGYRQAGRSPGPMMVRPMTVRWPPR